MLSRSGVLVVARYAGRILSIHSRCAVLREPIQGMMGGCGSIAGTGAHHVNSAMPGADLQSRFQLSRRQRRAGFNWSSQGDHYGKNTPWHNITPIWS